VDELRRQHCKLCDVRDFDDPALLEAIRDVVPERDPRVHVERKVWEIGMLVLFLADVDRLNRETRVLAVGAGQERVLFWLAERVGHLVATDIYGTGPFAAKEAPATMLTDPARHAPGPYPQERLETRFMDARALDFPDASFDVAFSLSSFEHFGGPSDVMRAARELGRVLRPGGHAFIATDCFLRRHPLDSAPADFARRVLTLGRRFSSATPRRRAALGEVFTPRELQTRIVAPAGLELVQPLDTRVSPATLEGAVRLGPDGEPAPAPGREYPRVALRAKRSVFTSAALALRRPDAGESLTPR